MLGEKVASVNDIPSPPSPLPFLRLQPPTYPSGQEMSVFVVVVFVIVTTVIVVILAQFQSDLNTGCIYTPDIPMASRRLCQGSLFPFITNSLCIFANGSNS